VALGAVKSEECYARSRRQQNLAYLSRDELPSRCHRQEPLGKVPPQYAVCPVSVENGQLTVATADPLNPVVVDDLRQFTGLAVKLVVSSAEAITSDRPDVRRSGHAAPADRRGHGRRAQGEGEEDVNQLRDMRSRRRSSGS